MAGRLNTQEGDGQTDGRRSEKSITKRKRKETDDENPNTKGR